MKFSEFMAYFLVAFGVTFAANSIVVFAYNIVAHGQGAFDLRMTLIFAFTLGLFFPIMDILLTGRRDMR